MKCYGKRRREMEDLEGEEAEEERRENSPEERKYNRK
jgi:hypothetical protein